MKRAVLLLARELHLGGSERQLAEIALGLDRSRFEPHVGAFRPDGLRGRELREAGIRIAHFPVYSFRSRAALSGIWQMAGYIRRHRIDLVHAFDAPLNVYATPVARFFTSAVVVASQRWHRRLTPEFHRLLRLTDRLVDGIVVNCEHLKRHLIQEERVSERVVHVCYNGIDLERFRRQANPRPAGLPQEALVIGVVCALRPEKALHLLLEAFARVRGRGPSLKLAIVGSGPLRQDLETLATRLGILADCVFQPATGDVPEWLSAMDIFVLPSLEEAFSNAIMEAMACGCAVAASRVGGNPELIEDGVRGLLFPSGDAEELARTLRRLIEDPELRRRLAAAGEGFVRENFSRAASARRMEEIYEALLARRRR